LAVLRARFNLSHDGQLGWEFREVGSTHGIAITRRSREGRDVAIGDDRLSKNSASGVQ
jgi:hypothetical protein